MFGNDIIKHPVGLAVCDVTLGVYKSKKKKKDVGFISKLNKK